MATILAMLLDRPGGPLRLIERSTPTPGPGEVRLRVLACGVCRTDLHILDGDLPLPHAPLVLGHEIVGRVEAVGAGVGAGLIGRRLGVPWLGGTCGCCQYCGEGAENLCDAPRFTGWTRDGGYAEAVVADARFCFPVPETLGDVEAAPLLCAGLIGFRSWRKACEARPVLRLGLYGFGAAAHCWSSWWWRAAWRCSPSCVRATGRRLIWLCRWAAPGPEDRMRRRRAN